MIEYSRISCQVPSAWKAKLERLATERHRAPEQIFYEAIAQYLGETAVTEAAERDPMVMFSAEIAVLRQEVSSLRAMIQSATQPFLAQADQSNSSADISAAPAMRSTPSSSLTDDDWDEDEDEPDEILYDFLEPDRRVP